MHSSQKKNHQMFDLKTHSRGKDGKVSRSNPYRLVIENGVSKFERPPNSGYWYDAQNNLIQKPKAGEVKKAEKKQEVDIEAALAKLAALEAENAELKSQLDESEETTGNEIIDDLAIPVAPEVDLSEEAELMAAAGVESAKIEEVKKGFQMPGFLKG